MIELPKSLTAIVHVRFHYGEGGKNTEPRRAELLSKVLDRASELNPELQMMLVDFAGHVDRVSSDLGSGGQSPEKSQGDGQSSFT